MTTKRNRTQQTVSLENRLLVAAKTAREAAAKLPQGPERDALMNKARELENAARVNGWMASPGLQSPD
jgi:hypothetical protein